MIIPSSSSSKLPTPPPVLILTGPDLDNTVYITHPNGSRTPLFTITTSRSSKPNVTISRLQLGPNGPTAPPQELCTGVFSSMTGSITLNLNGVDTKLREGLEGFEFPGPMGELRWKTSTGDKYDLVDRAKTKIARYRVKGGEPRLQVFVPCEDRFMDLVVCSAISLGVQRKKSGEEVEATMEIVGHLLGA